MKSSIFTIRYITLVTTLVVGAVLVCPGQNADYRRSDGRIEISLGQPISKVEIQAVYVLDDKGQSVTFLPSRINGGSGFGGGTLWVSVAKGSIAPDLSKNPVQVEAVIRDADGKTLFVTMPLKEVNVQRPYSDMVKQLKSEIASADNKDEAELYLSGTVTTAVKSKPNWVADIKYAREFVFDRFPFVVAPFVKVQYDSKASKTDKLSFGLKFSKGFSFSLPTSSKISPTALELLANAQKESSGELTRLKRTWAERAYFDYSGTLEFESDWDFRVNNLITSQELKYLSKPKYHFNDNKLVRKMIFTPFIGAELGANLKNPLLAGSRAIARIKAGADFAITQKEPFGRGFAKELVWDTTFVERWFIKDEFAFDKDDDGKLIFKAFGRVPRAHFKTSLSFKLNDYFGPEISYEWGQEPPLYEKVRHQMKFALVYSFARKSSL